VDRSHGDVMDLNPVTQQLLGYARDELVSHKLWRSGHAKLAQSSGGNRTDSRSGCTSIRGSDLADEDGRDLRANDRERVLEAIACDSFNIRDAANERSSSAELQETQAGSLGLLAGASRMISTTC